MQQLDTMYSVGSPSYSIPMPGFLNGTSLSTYPSLTHTCNNQHQTFLPANQRFISTSLQNRTSLPIFPNSATAFSSQGLTAFARDTFYPMPQAQGHSSMTGTVLRSPMDPKSPDSLHSDNQETSSVSPLHEFGYPSTPKTMNNTFINFPPSMNFTNNTSNSSMHTSPILPKTPVNSTYNYPEYNPSMMTEMSSVGRSGWSPYPGLPSSSGPLSHPCSVTKLSYDSPRFKLTPERAIPLIKWFEEHKDHPYPTRHEKMLLCQSTQLTFTQVSTWFANARRRMKKANLEEEELAHETNSDCSDSPKNLEKTSVVMTETYSSTLDVSKEDSHQEQYVKTHERESTKLWNTIY